MKKTVALALFLFALGCIVGHVTGCKPPNSPLEETAGATYAGDQMWCVDRFNTDPEIDACRAAVRRRWGITETVTRKDGGR